jgi:hypothetical protein
MENAGQLAPELINNRPNVVTFGTNYYYYYYYYCYYCYYSSDSILDSNIEISSDNSVLHVGVFGAM